MAQNKKEENNEQMVNPFDSVAKDFMERTEKLMKGYEVLKEVEEVEVATAEKKLVWQEDKVKLYHYVSDQTKKAKTPVIVSYALVNRSDMMDLEPDRSFIRKLLKDGIDIYLIDWGYPGRAERYLTMDDYINGYIDGCVDFVREHANVPKVNLMGICQGGTFSAIYTALNKEKVKNLITLVAPYDFDTEDGLLFKWSRDLDVDKIVDANNGVVPGSFLNMGFDMLKPISKVKKYANIVDVMQDKEKLMTFLRMEKWVADSPNQAGECYRQFIKDLYQENKLIKGELKVGNHQVDLKEIDVPVLTIYATHDHLVPPSATEPFHDYISSKDKTMYAFPGGHIGVFVGSRSQKELGPKVAEWLTKHD